MVVFVSFEVFFVVIGLADDSEIDGAYELYFSGVYFTVDHDELDGGVETGSPVDGGGFSWPGWTIDDEGVGDEVVFESEELSFGGDIELGIGRVGEAVLEEVGEELVEGGLQHWSERI